MSRSSLWSFLGLALIVATVSLGLFLAPGLDRGVATVSVGHHGERTGRQWFDLVVAAVGFVAVLVAAGTLFVTREGATETRSTALVTEQG